MRHSRWYSCHVRRLNDERLVTDPVLSASFEQDVRLFGVMHMKSWSAARMRLRNDEGERLESVLVTGESMCELAGRAVLVFQLVKTIKECSRVVRLLR